MNTLSASKETQDITHLDWKLSPFKSLEDPQDLTKELGNPVIPRQIVAYNLLK